MIEEKLKILFEDWSNEKIIFFEQLPPSGSNRIYYRIKSKDNRAIGVYNPDRRENEAFIYLTNHFLSKGLNVPIIYSEKLDDDIYLIQDLGDTTLFSFIEEKRNENELSEEVKKIYKKVIEELPRFQIIAGKDLDYSVCYPRSEFDKQSMMWDLNYFKYYFLKLAKISFDEQRLENDFQTFTNYLLKADSEYFLYRDFQSRNIMLKDYDIYFIDYQGGRKGALQYDLASLLFDAKANLPQSFRDELLEHYIQSVKKYLRIDVKQFKEFFFGFVLIRIMQAMGAYGYRGFYERKEHFLKSIPFALKNLEWILNNHSFPVELSELDKALKEIISSDELKKFGTVEKKRSDKLTVRVFSFSYKSGIPNDKWGNGGGFVFDCRAIHNPGRYDEYKNLTGKDKPVIDFLKKDGEADNLLDNAFKIIDQSVERYIECGFESLMISFGCTGGQHRSVYCAEEMGKHLNDKFDVKVIVEHVEQNFKGEGEI